MTHSPDTPQPPPRRQFDSQFEREESSVRSRAPLASGPASGQRRARATELPPPAHHDDTPVVRESVAERSLRIQQKIAIAEHLLDTLKPTDRRARLLGSAILRRDEVLLDAVLRGAPTDNVVSLPRAKHHRK